MKSDELVIEYYARNLKAVYCRSIDSDQESGEVWYAIAKDECRKISRETGFSLKRVVWAMAALSNNKSWEANVDLTRAVCFQLRNGKQATGHFGHLIEKAVGILEDGNLGLLSGPKVIPFAMAIYQSKSNAAVVDRWMWRAAYDLADEVPLYLTPARLARVAIALRRVARHLQVPVSVLQAIIWITIRRESSMLPREG